MKLLRPISRKIIFSFAVAFIGLSWLFDVHLRLTDKETYYLGGCIFEAKPGWPEEICVMGSTELPAGHAKFAISFEIDKESKSVVELPTFGQVFEHKDCAIWDKKNWSCGYGLQVKDGELHYLRLKKPDPMRFFVIPKYKWVYYNYLKVSDEE